MKRLLIIMIIALIAGCSNPDPVDLNPVTPPVTPPVEPPVDPVDPTDPPVDAPNETVNVTVEPVILKDVDPQLDPKTVVDAYLDLMTKALDGDTVSYEDAYKLISPHSTKNIHWMASLDRFISEADDTYEIYDSGNNLTGWLETEEYGTSYRVFYSYDDDEEVYYITQTYDGLYYIATGSKRGSMFWRFTGPE